MISLQSKFFVKSVIALALAVSGYCALSRSLAVVVAKADPVLALGIWSRDARIMASAAEQMVERANTDADRQKGVVLARRAQLRDGTTVLAADAIAFSAGFSDDEATAARWFDYAEKWSRRDLRTQLYFIESAVARGDVKTALHHYDIALRASDVSAPQTLYPVLRNAVSDPNVRDELAKILAAKPIWSNSFLFDLTNNGPDFGAAALLVISMHQLGTPVAGNQESSLLTNLMSNKDIHAAWRLYLALHPAVGRSFTRNGNFAGGNSNSSPFDWQLSSADGVSAEMGIVDGAGALDYRLSPTTSATVAQQRVFLPPGRFRLTSVLGASSQKLGSGPFWQIACPDGREIARLEMGDTLTRPRSFSVEFAVPAECSPQTLALVARSSDDVAGATGQLRSVSIVKVQP